MTYRLSLQLRQRLARNKRDRYYRDPDYRLQRINDSRRHQGLPQVPSLDAVKLRKMEA